MTVRKKVSPYEFFQSFNFEKSFDFLPFDAFQFINEVRIRGRGLVMVVHNVVIIAIVDTNFFRVVALIGLDRERPAEVIVLFAGRGCRGHLHVFFFGGRFNTLSSCRRLKGLEELSPLLLPHLSLVFGAFDNFHSIKKIKAFLDLFLLYAHA